jgi:mgtE-like transporter
MARVRVVPRRSSRLVRLLWIAERRTFRQGLVALALSTLAGFVAGLTLGHLAERLEAFPGLLILIPAAVGMKGTVFGAVGARLGTASAAGTFEPTLRRGSVLRRNVDVAIVTSFASSVWLAVLARVASTVFGQRSIPLSALLVISVVGGTIGAAAVLLATVALALASHLRGWDLDAVATPLVTALGDVTTLPALLVATSLVRHPGHATVLGGVCLGVGVSVAGSVGVVVP